MKTILVVDDSVINLKSIKRLLKDTYKVVAVNSANDAFKYLKTAIPDLILLDVLMPDVDGFQMMEQLKSNQSYEEIPVIFLTADNDKEKELQGFRLGAVDFILKPFEPDVVRSRINRAIELETLRNNLKEEVRAKTKEVEQITFQSLMSVAETLDSKMAFSLNHSYRIAKISEEIARRLNKDEDDVTNVYYTALLHDIGNIAIPDNIFYKQGKLTKEERELIKRHTIMGADILSNISIKNVTECVRSHHEWYNGKGYPDQLIGEEIPLIARILAVSDAYEAMAHDRVYRKKLSEEAIIKEFTDCSGVQFDPKITQIMLELIKEKFVQNLGDASDQYAEGIAYESTNLLQEVITQYTNEVHSEANKDPLTGLWNRKYTMRYVDVRLSKPEPKGTVFMIDIDNFKAINDNFGHVAGDKIIIDIAEVLKAIGRQDDIACRIGGDEFLIFFPDMYNPEVIKNVASRLLKNLVEKVRYPDNSCGISASIGIAVAPKDGTEFQKLYNNADKALYHAKNNGKNTYHFFSTESGIYYEQGSIKEDLLYIKKMLNEEEPINGSYYVEYESFKNISRFIRRGIERSRRQVVYILFSIDSKGDEGILIDELQVAMTGLEEAIRMSLRIGDVATKYSSTQMLAILMDTNEINAFNVAHRIFADFIKHNENLDVELHYDLRQMEFLHSKES